MSHSASAYERASDIEGTLTHDLSKLGYEHGNLRDTDPRTKLECLNYIRTVRISAELMEEAVWEAQQ